MAIREVSKEVIVKVGKPAIPVKLTLSEPSCPVVAGVVLTHGAGGDMDSSYLPRLAAALAVAGVSCVRFTCRTLHLPTRVNAVQAVLREAASSWAETAQVPCWFCAGHSMGGRAACQVAYNSWQQQQQEQEEQHEPQAEEASQDVVPLVEQTRRTKRGDQAATEQRGEQALTSEARGAMEELAKRTRGAAETNGGIADLVQETGSGGEEGPGGGGDGGGGGGGSGAQCVPLPHVEIGRDDNDAGPSATGRAPPGDPRVVGCLLLSYPLHPPDKPDELRDDPLCKLRCPLLFVRGSRDEFSRQELLAGVMKRMASTHVQVHTVEGGDHSLQVTGGKRKRRLDDAVPSPEEAVAGRETACQEDIDHLQDVLHAVITFVKGVAGGVPAATCMRARAEKRAEV
ncbi:hypothetical protein Vafri_6587 [Volvox africanus]|uniref:KANL3/Tex30 alpha/beta hydrolase-like domain-containing protein n=1 Tax=Volvox africanus TaxID=51714 RepID=A0A8J4AYP1_9CHLO|nr:hypothetical protein Vafri_6587 [Volvox africanus]